MRPIRPIEESPLIPKHGGYRSLASFQNATLVYDLTVEFCNRHMTYKTYLAAPEDAANLLVCLIHQTNYLLDQQLRALEASFLREGGFTERLYAARKRTHRSY